MRYSLPQDRSTRFTNQRQHAIFTFKFYPLAYNEYIYVFILYIHIYIICIYIYTHILKVKLSICICIYIYIICNLMDIILSLSCRKLSYTTFYLRIYVILTQNRLLSPLQIDLQIANFQNCECETENLMKMEAPEKRQERQEEEEVTAKKTTRDSRCRKWQGIVFI